MKRIVSIQDISCFGKCSLTVALPICSALGVETCVLPTTILSTHTGSGFEGYTYRDLTADIPLISAHWKSLGLHFDAICTGYLGSYEQIKLVNAFFDEFGTEDTCIIVDPVLGDKGAFYKGFDKSFAQEMRRICARADVILPNLTEAALLLGQPYMEQVRDEEAARSILYNLAEIGAKVVALTGVGFDDRHQGVMAYDRRTGEFYSYFSENIPGYFHSTGDIFSATFSGALVRGMSMQEALRLAVDFTVESIRRTIGYEKEHWYSVRFEEAIPMLVERIN